MNQKIIIGVIILVVIFLISFNSFNQSSNEILKEEESVNEEQKEILQVQPIQAPSIRYFNQGSDKIILVAENKTLSFNDPTTTLSYSAVDSFNNQVHFKSSDRAFVRALGVSVPEPYTQNKEIFHPEGNDTIFIGNITFPWPGVYLVKVCLGPDINLNSEGKMIWPFGCFEDSTSLEIKVYDN